MTSTPFAPQLAHQNQISYGRLAYIYYDELARNAKRLSSTSTEVIKKLKMLKRPNAVRDIDSPKFLSSLRDDNQKEAKLVQEVLGFSRQCSVAFEEELVRASYPKRWSNKNAGSLLALATGGDLGEGELWAEGGSVGSNDPEQAGLTSSPSDLQACEQFVKSLRSTALQCVEAISNLTKEVVVEGVPFDVEKTRSHFNRTFAKMLSTEEDTCPVETGLSWKEDEKDGCAATAALCMNKRNTNEKDLLKEVLSGLTSFLSFLEAINCYVNMEKVSSTSEAQSYMTICSNLNPQFPTRFVFIIAVRLQDRGGLAKAQEQGTRGSGEEERASSENPARDQEAQPRSSHRT